MFSYKGQKDIHRQPQFRYKCIFKNFRDQFTLLNPVVEPATMYHKKDDSFVSQLDACKAVIIETNENISFKRFTKNNNVVFD